MVLRCPILDVRGRICDATGHAKLGTLVGTYKMLGEHVEVAIPAALQCGYRLFDTATIYRNEEHVGRVLREQMEAQGIRREDVFVTSKLQTLDQGYDRARAAVDASLQKLGLDYIDLYLIHWPGASATEPSDPRNAILRRESWKALEEALAAGKLRAIGVSNYMVRHLQEMEGYAQVPPMVNQIELHPLYYPRDVVQYCQQRGILVQAYSSLGRGKLLEDAFLAAHPPIGHMMHRHGVSAGQVYLRWALQHNFGILPKSNDPGRIATNADLFGFVLDPAEMQYLDDLSVQEWNKICWDPQGVA